MFRSLAEVCHETRTSANVKLTTIAHLAERDQSAIYRFESGVSVPRDMETVVDAYAKACGVPPAALWAGALRRFEGVEVAHSHQELMTDGNMPDSFIALHQARLDMLTENLIVATDEITQRAIRAIVAARDGEGNGLDTKVLKALMDHAPLGIVVFDREMRYVRVNSASADLALTDAEDMIGKTVTEVHGDPSEEALAAFKQALEAGTAYAEYEVVIPGADARREADARQFSQRWVRIDADHVLCIVRETTQQREIARLLSSL